MFETLVSMPFSFWVTVGIGLAAVFFGIDKLRVGIGLPMLAVLSTVGVWYVMDLFYNGYDYYTQTFTADILSRSWWQVALFLAAFRLLAPELHKRFNAAYAAHPSAALRLARTGVGDPYLQQRLTQLLQACLIIWSVLAVIAAFRLEDGVLYYFFPFLGVKYDPWGRDRLGTGFDSLLSLAGYVQLFTAASFGITAALLTHPRTRSVAICACIIAWPYFIFDRTRNVMLSSMIPGILSWVILRMRGFWIKKVLVLAVFLFLVNVWFGFVIANRSGMTIMEALREKGFNISENVNVHHEGLNMFEELCWINTLTDSGVFRPTWGGLYFAELVSPIPRALWPSKPASTLDYAVARGQAHADTGEGATISTGMIGQGVVSFGPILGPSFAGFLMSIWAVILARIDLRGQDIVLYGFGLILTFNLGRDITTLTLYTFIFGSIAVWVANRMSERLNPSDDLRMSIYPNNPSRLNNRA